MWLPRMFTSGGQSGGAEVLEVLEAVGAVAVGDGADEAAIDFLVKAAQSATEVQERQLIHCQYSSEG